MATYSTNQVRHLYVANALKTPHVVAGDADGSIAVKNDTAKTHLYFEYKGVGGLMRSDLIDTKNILSVKATDADSMAQELKTVTVTLDKSINSGEPVAGQDYVLRISFRQYVGMSDEDIYFKYGEVHTYPGDTASKFYAQMAISLAKNFSRELTPLLQFALKTASTTVVVDATTKLDALTDTYTGLEISEVPQEWTLGIKEQVPVYFTVQPTTIIADGDERLWGTVAETTPVGIIDNGKKIADLEYFCMGERGDIYRNIGWPNSIPTKYLVDPSKKYNVIDIHYAYIGDNESVQKSEKTMTLVVPKVGATNSVSNKLANDIITAINTATGLTVAKLDASTGA